MIIIVPKVGEKLPLYFWVSLMGFWEVGRGGNWGVVLVK
jgi:hypothetical protein